MHFERYYTLGIAVAVCVATSITAVVAQGNGNGNGKGNTNKEAATEKGTEKNNDNPERKRHKPTRLKDFVEQKKAEAEANREKGKGNKPDKDNKGSENRGNAYGKNKGELSGREFGQARAAAAKQNGEQKREHLAKTITAGDTKVADAQGRLARAIEELERKRKTGTITDTEYNEKKVTISLAEKAIQVLEEKVNAAKVLVSVPVVE